MRSFLITRKVVLAGVLAAAGLYGQSKGMPPRATPGDYQAHAQTGAYTIGAEYAGHSIPDPQSVLSTEDYVVVEVGFFGPADAHLNLSYENFSLRINGKKSPYPAQEVVQIFKSLKNPDYEPPTKSEAKTKMNTSGGGGGGADANPLPPVVHIPIEVERAMQQKVQKMSLPGGDRALPAAGLIFFEHHGKANSVELIYNGPAGKVTLPLQP